jgi:RNase P/RNase MRP subunit p29
VNLIGEKLTVLSSSDPTKVGRTGRVMLETANTLLLDSGGKMIRMEKEGSAFRLLGSGKVVTGSEVAGRLQDRLARKTA